MDREKNVEKFAIEVSMAIDEQLETSNRVQSEMRDAFKISSLDQQLRSYSKRKQMDSNKEQFTTPVTKEAKSSRNTQENGKSLKFGQSTERSKSRK